MRAVWTRKRREALARAADVTLAQGKRPKRADSEGEQPGKNAAGNLEEKPK